MNRPLAGTRRRGATEIEDQALEDELLADEKERAEHVMLVDLGRNDVGKVRNSCRKQRGILGVTYVQHRCEDLYPCVVGRHLNFVRSWKGRRWGGEVATREKILPGISLRR